MVYFQASVSKGWIHEKGDFEFSERYYRNPLFRFSQDKKINDLVTKEFGDYPFYNMEANLMQAEFVTENQVLVGGIQPNLILAFVLGAEFVYYPDKDMDVSGNPLQYLSSEEGLPNIQEILEHFLIKELDSQILNLQNEHPELRIIPPFFWDSSGRATIHGLITTSFKLIGDNAMVMIMINPELLHAVHRWITEAYIVLINHYSRMAGIPVTSIHVGECSGAMISNDQYREFVTPYVSQLGQTFGKVRLHSCGHSDHIIDAISDIKNLGIIDTGSNTSISRIREIMGQDFEINIEPPVKLMLEGTPEEDLLAWLENTLYENQGGPLKLALHLDTGYSTLNCLKLYEELSRRL
jgi:hypothetical protein